MRIIADIHAEGGGVITANLIQMKIGLLHSTIREDEKLLLAAAERRGIEIARIDVREQVLSPVTWTTTCDIMLERCLSTTLGTQAVLFLESLGVPVVNGSRVAHLCDNKFLTSLTLRNAKVPTPPFALVFSEQEAIAAVEKLGGYPVVLKPIAGSWGRLIAKINDQDALEGVIEQRLVMGSPSQKALYLQKYVEKNDRDIRTMVVGNEVVSAMYRETQHWITNIARGAQARPCPLSPALIQVSLAAVRAVGGGILGVDLFETEDGLSVNEINHTPEFKGLQTVSERDIADVMLTYCMSARESTIFSASRAH